MMLSDLCGLALSDPAPAITAVTADSRKAGHGAIFVAIAGAKADGRQYIADAVRRGAVAVICRPEAAADVPAPAIAIASHNPRLALALLSAQVHPGQPATIAAVTGTNGKTSVAAFTRQLWSALGRRAASLGTLGVATAEGTVALAHTTPDPADLHRILDTLAANGITHLAFEASSHGLDQFRVDAVRVKAAGFTNLTRDHMDYHPSFAAYREAKLRLFTEVLPRGGLAVVNADGAEAPAFAHAARRAGHRLVQVGAAGGDLTLLAQRPHARGADLTIGHAGRRFEVALPLPGAFQAGNALVAAAFVIGLGAPSEQVLPLLARLQGAPGRLEFAGATPEGATVFIDYAHTPDAIDTVLAALRPHAEGRLVIVFGCGGDRDPGKRPLMGAAAARGADVVIVTDDNPRSEDPALIRKAVLAGAPEAREIGDRAEAIAAAIGMLRAGDVLVIAGKGHEQGQIVGSEVRPFSDLSAARAVLGHSGGRAA